MPRFIGTKNFPDGHYLNAGTTYDIDYISYREGTHATRIADGAITARSHHIGIVQIAMMDGSTRPISENINITIWRALGTRTGSEVLGGF